MVENYYKTTIFNTVFILLRHRKLHFFIFIRLRIFKIMKQLIFQNKYLKYLRHLEVTVEVLKIRCVSN